MCIHMWCTTTTTTDPIEAPGSSRDNKCDWNACITLRSRPGSSNKRYDYYHHLEIIVAPNCQRGKCKPRESTWALIIIIINNNFIITLSSLLPLLTDPPRISLDGWSRYCMIGISAAAKLVSKSHHTFGSLQIALHPVNHQNIAA